MIHYSSIKDAWGKKDMFKNNKPLEVSPKVQEPIIQCQASVKEPEIIPPEIIKYDLPVNQPIIQQNVQEHFVQNNCAFMEHLQNCPFCMSKMKEHFNETTSSIVEEPISTINIFGFKINITKDVLRILFIIILSIIFILLLRIVNVSFKNTNNKYLNMPNEDLLRLITQMKYINALPSNSFV